MRAPGFLSMALDSASKRSSARAVLGHWAISSTTMKSGFNP